MTDKGISKARDMVNTVLSVGFMRAVSIRAIWLSETPASKASCACVNPASALSCFNRTPKAARPAASKMSFRLFFRFTSENYRVMEKYL